jgi:hypothetical protein
MPEFTVHFRSKKHIDTRVSGHREGPPGIGAPEGMAFGSAEILYSSPTTCLYFNFRCEAQDRAIDLTSVKVEATANGMKPLPSRRGLSLKLMSKPGDHRMRCR